MSNIDIYKDNYENRGTDISYKCRTAITFKVKVQVAIGYTAVSTVGWYKKGRNINAFKIHFQRE